MQIPKKLKAVLIIIISTLIIIMPVCVALIREYSYKDNQGKKVMETKNPADSTTNNKESGK